MLCTAFKEYQDNPMRFLAPCLDGSYSLAANPVAHFGPASRKSELAVFGALTALLIANGIAPVLIDPVYIYYLIHGCNFHLITPGLLQEWHQEFHSVVAKWLSESHTGNIRQFSAHIMTYLDIDVSASGLFPMALMLKAIFFLQGYCPDRS